MELVVVLLILAIIAAIFGFGGIASAVTSIALILFWIFLAIFIIGLLFRLLSGHWWYGHHHHDQLILSIKSQTLGLKVDWEDSRGAMFESGDGSMLHIYKRGPTKADHTAVVFQVEGIDSEVKELRQKGIKFEEYDMPDLGVKTINGISTRRVGDQEAKSAWFKDTEGNILSLVQMTKVGVISTAQLARWRPPYLNAACKEQNMIIRLVKFKSALSDSEVLKRYEQRAPQYRKLNGLINKYYIKDNQTGEHGAVYLWDSMQSMQEFQQSELSRTIPEVYQVTGQPRVEVLNVVFTLRM